MIINPLCDFVLLCSGEQWRVSSSCFHDGLVHTE